MMQNYKLTLSYDGSRYRGWQKQGNTDNTLQTKLETLLRRILGQEIELSACGRTDAGVHARMQVCSFKAETMHDCAFLLSELRRQLPDDIGAISLEIAPPRFHARLSCVEKSYLYRVWNSQAPNVFERKFMLRYPSDLDISKMKEAATSLIGKHDFASFCSNRHMKKSTVRTISCIDISRNGEELDFMLTGDGFLYNMVRIIVGTLLEVGSGLRDVESVAEALNSADRQRAGFTAPPQGLFLWEIKY